MLKQFDFEVFLMHDAADKDAVRFWAEKLVQSGLTVWYDEWRPQPIINVASYVEKSRTLVVFISENSITNWGEFESQILMFRDPLNRERRFVPVHLDQSEIPKSIADLLLIDLQENTDTSLSLLIDACTPLSEPESGMIQPKRRINTGPRHTYPIGLSPRAMAISGDGKFLLVAHATQVFINEIRKHGKIDGDRKLIEKTELRTFQLTHASDILSWDKTQQHIATASRRKISIILNYLESPSINEIDVSKGEFTALALTSGIVAAGQSNGVVRLWETNKSAFISTLRGHSAAITSIAINSRRILTSSKDRTVRYWDADSQRCIRVFEGHSDIIGCVVSRSDEKYALSGSDDGSIRQWDLISGMCTHVFAGHTARIAKISWSTNGQFFASAAEDRTVRIWDCISGSCVAVLDGHQTDVRDITWISEFELIAVDSIEARHWLLESVIKSVNPMPVNTAFTENKEDQVLYTNAKVLLVGESGAGKTGLSKRLALNIWELSSSTVGAWATQWKLPLEKISNSAMEKEIWLWDFGGQADQRLIHQLYMDETSLVVLVFDGQKSDVFDALNQWDNDLQRASKSEFVKLLAAGRIDASPLRISKSNIQSFVKEKGYKAFFETSALTGNGCQELKDAVLSGIDWDRIPWRSSPRLFKLLKDEIVKLKDQGKILMRFNDLREMLVLKMHGKADRFSDAQLKSVLSLLAGPGVISELAFGGWILFQPQLINVYAQAAIHKMLEDQSELGFILESDVLAGNLSFHGLERVPDDEIFILLAMHHALLERGLCAREMTEQGNILVFPSYYKRQRPELKGHPAVLVSYAFDGFAAEIYSTLVVRLHHTNAFKRDNLWQDAADFRSIENLQIGLKLRKASQGSLIEVYSDPSIPIGEKILFVRYVHEHLLQRATNVLRKRHYVCQGCGHAVVDLEAPSIRIRKNFSDMGCPACDYRITLIDEMEKLYSSSSMTKSVQVLDDSVAMELDNESKERLLVGEVISAVALANQICREKNVSDHGIDAEIEFKNQFHDATGTIIYLQLKSGDSYLRTSANGKEIFTIKKPRHSKYWMDQNCPVMLVIRSSTGEVRWMEIRHYLKEQYKKRQADAKSWGRSIDDEETLPTQIEFIGEKFDTRSILKWRNLQLGSNLKKEIKFRKKSL